MYFKRTIDYQGQQYFLSGALWSRRTITKGKIPIEYVPCAGIPMFTTSKKRAPGCAITVNIPGILSNVAAFGESREISVCFPSSSLYTK
jgi:hypothetical protein